MVLRNTIFLLALGFMVTGCSYSFTGSSVPSHLKTIAIPLFDDQSGSGEPSLREEFTKKLIDRFVQDNSLQVTDRSAADAIIEGTIVAMPDQPLVVEAGETVSKRRVTITVKATYQDLKLRKKVWEKEFSNWGDYESSGGIESRSAGIAAAIEKLTEDILIETVSGW